MYNHKEALQEPSFKDRKIGLVVFGIFEVIIGLFYALTASLMALGMIFSATLNKGYTGPMSTGMVIYLEAFYSLSALWFIWMGIGSIKARRWARALWLVSSWVWLIVGIGWFIFHLIFLADILDQRFPGGPLSTETLLIMLVIYAIAPGALVLFYGSRNVKATCEFRNPQACWTDKCPLPVLSLSLMYGFSGGSMLLMGSDGWVIPFFGCILSGVAGAAIALISAVLYGYVAWGTYKLSIQAWCY